MGVQIITNELWTLITILHLTNCNPEVYISDGPTELSGPQCPDTVTFTCNALKFNSPRISWFAGDTVLATYSYYAEDVFPVEVRTEPTIDATAQIMIVNFTNGIDYINFTLSVNLTELVSFRGQNIACGTTSMKSNAIGNNFEIPNDLNIEVQAVYMDTALSNVIAKWNNIFPNCGIELNYSIIFRNDKDVLLVNEELEPSECYNHSCTLDIAVIDIATSYFLQINVTGIDDIYSKTSEIGGSSTFYINYSVKEENCMVIFKCSSIISEGCLLRYRINERWQAPISVDQEIMQPLNFTLHQTYRLEINSTYNNTQILVITNYTTGSFPHEIDFKTVYTAALFVFILGIVLLTSGYILIVITYSLNIIKHKIFCKYSLMLSIMPLLLFITTLALWIAFGVLSHGTCQMKGTISYNLLIAASLFSCLLPCLSVVVLGGLILSIETNCSKLKQQKEPNSAPNLIILDWKIKGKSYKCGQCKIKTRNNNFCAKCDERLCNTCYKQDWQVFTGRNLGFRVACQKCYDEYWKENEKFNKKSVPEVSTKLRLTSPHFCKSCEQTSKNSKNTAQITEHYAETDDCGRCEHCQIMLCNTNKFCYNKKAKSSDKLVCMLCFIIMNRKDHYESQTCDIKETPL